MKKRYLLGMFLLMGWLATGCQSKEEPVSAVVEELPIETGTEMAQNKENKPKQDADAVYVPEEKEPYDGLQVEVKGDKGTITVGTTGAPFTELLTQAKLQLAEDGWDLH